MAMMAEGHSVAVALDGQAAIERVADWTPDVIVLDLRMPVMDGRAFYRELRRNGCDVPVVILSAFGADDGRRELGAQAHVNKPFDPDELVQTVTAAAGHGSAD